MVGAMIAQGKVAEAVNFVSQKLDAARQDGARYDEVGVVSLQLSLAETHLAQGNPEKALLIVREANDVCDRRSASSPEDTTLRVTAALIQCTSLHQLQRGEEALPVAQAALTLAQGAGDKESLAKVWHMLANIHAVLGDAKGASDKSLDAARKAVELYRELQDQRSEGSVLRTMSELLNSMGRHQDAIQRAEEAVARYEALDDCKGLVAALQALAYAKCAADEAKSAIALLETKVGAFAKQQQKEAEGALRLVLADVVLEAQDNASALREAKAALNIFKLLGDRRQEGTALLKIADVECLSDNHDEALRVSNQALRYFEDLGMVQGQAEAKCAVALAYTRMGAPEKSPYRQEALSSLSSLVAAVERRDFATYSKAMLSLNNAGGITQEDLQYAMQPLMVKDEKGTRNFFRENGLVNQVEMAETASEISSRDQYYGYRSGGLQYGPAFRGAKTIFRRGEKGHPDAEALAVLQLNEACEGWEEQVVFIHPGLNDSALQSQACLFE
jgi:tetratricopeptide (TPR) repeat protein